MSPALVEPLRSKDEAARDMGQRARRQGRGQEANPLTDKVLAAAWAAGWDAEDQRIKSIEERRHAG